MAAITRDRAAKKRIALAVACFDTLNVAIIRALQSAAGRVDRTIVAVLNDPAVRTRLGGGRPVVVENDRAELVDAVRGVDYVIVCSEDDVERLATRVGPDVRV